MYRPEWFARESQGRNVLQIALDLHMGCSGSAERSREEQARDHALLTHVVESWKPTLHEKYRDFDTCVLNIVLAALEESREDAIEYPLYGASVTEAFKSLSAWRIRELDNEASDNPTTAHGT